MAKRKNNKGTIIVNDASDKAMDEVFGMIDDINPDSGTLSESSLSNVSDWIDTGNLALNAICSGSVFGGIPSGRITGIFGPPQTGKTLVTNKIIANGQKKGYRAVYFDSEQALEKKVAERLGCDTSKIKHAPVEVVEECRNQIFQLLTKCIDLGIKRKLMVCIDSLGALNTLKELNDSMSDKNASDMGLKAKLLKSMLLKLTYRAAKSETPVIFTNHIYDSVGDMYPSMVKKQAGGLSPLFIASLLIQLSSTNIKVGDDKGQVGMLSDRISGTKLRAFITKNRFVPPYLSTEMYLNFKTGLDRYSGLLDLAVSMKMIEQTGSSYVYGDQKLGYASTFATDPKFWDGDMLNELDLRLKKELTYSNECYADLKKEVDLLDKETLNDPED